MKTVIIYIRGLNTKADSNWCGIRKFLKEEAAHLGADLIGLDYDDRAGLRGLEARLEKYDIIIGMGHSHGAAALYEWCKTTKRRLALAVFLDLCPEWKPLAWMGSGWPAPENCDKVLVQYQRNDKPLAGVRLRGENVQAFDVSKWGLHHSDMCADERVQCRIALAMGWSHAEALNAKNRTVTE